MQILLALHAGRGIIKQERMDGSSAYPGGVDVHVNQSFSKRLNTALRVRNMRPADFCRRTGLSSGTASHYLSGRYVPKRDKMLQFAQALNVPELWLMGYGANEPEEFTKNFADENNPDLEIEFSVEDKIAYLMADISADSVLDGQTISPEALLVLKAALKTGLAIARDIEKEKRK